MGAAVHAQSRTLSLSFQKLRARVDACGGHRTGRGRVASHADELPTPWAAMVWWGRESGSSPVSHGRSCQAPPPCPVVSRCSIQHGNAVVTEAHCVNHIGPAAWGSLPRHLAVPRPLAQAPAPGTEGTRSAPGTRGLPWPGPGQVDGWGIQGGVISARGRCTNA